MAVLVKSLNGLAWASVKARNGLAVASIKSINGLSTASAGPGPDPDLLWWKMTEGSGTTVADSALTNTGTITGSSWVTGASGSGYALSFTGSSDKIVSGSNPTMSNTRLTVCAWLKPDVLTRGDIVTLWFSGSVSSQFNLLYGITSGKLNFYIANSSGSTANSGVSSDAMSTGTWYHVAGTYDGSNVKCYINGVEKASTASSLTLNTGSFEKYRVANNGLNDGRLQGSVDDARVYSTALTASELLQIYNYGAV